MNRRILAVLAALLLALFGTAAMFAYVSNADDRAIAGQEAVTVLMAAEEIPAGTTAAAAQKDGLVREDVLPRKAVPEDALQSVGPKVGKLVASAAIAPGQVLTRSRFSDTPVTTGGLAVPDGKVAVTVEMTHPGHVGSFIEPGAEVAVFDTFNVRESYTKEDVQAGDHIQDRHEYVRATRVLLSRVSVLGVDASTAASDKKTDEQGVTSDSMLVTLAVTPHQALKLVHVTYTGTPHFALLNSGTAPKAGDGLNDFSLFD